MQSNSSERDFLNRIGEYLGCVPNPTIIDVGAYVGKMARAFIDYNETAIVHCIEANLQNAKLIHPTIKEGGIFFGLKIHWCAISDKDEMVDFYSVDHAGSEGSSQANSLFKAFAKKNKWADKVNTHEVQAWTMDTFCKNEGIKHIDLLKVNCEGGEYKMFDAPSLDFLGITDMFYVSMHGKCDLFTSDEYIGKRRVIMTRLEDAGFKMVMGNSQIDHPKHIRQLWAKNTTTTS